MGSLFLTINIITDEETAISIAPVSTISNQLIPLSMERYTALSEVTAKIVEFLAAISLIPLSSRPSCTHCAIHICVTSIKKKVICRKDFRAFLALIACRQDFVNVLGQVV